ncbi:hypothetical protein OG599_15090 [Streptomyces sp. NBC_01335]|uniref:hypothetical protein n=1 Tax=Streptomyces sp. NBC_01335 TaxID=2903828 RepID=UPI002E1056EC|nr:hypothetical protein OG599_15090 [Streptomyces sp. NBC_01335]
MATSDGVTPDWETVLGYFAAAGTTVQARDDIGTDGGPSWFASHGVYPQADPEHNFDGEFDVWWSYNWTALDKTYSYVWGVKLDDALLRTGPGTDTTLKHWLNQGELTLGPILDDSRGNGTTSLDSFGAATEMIRGMDALIGEWGSTMESWSKQVGDGTDFSGSAADAFERALTDLQLATAKLRAEMAAETVVAALGDARNTLYGVLYNLRQDNAEYLADRLSLPVNATHDAVQAAPVKVDPGTVTTTTSSFGSIVTSSTVITPPTVTSGGLKVDSQEYWDRIQSAAKALWTGRVNTLLDAPAASNIAQLNSAYGAVSANLTTASPRGELLPSGESSVISSLGSPVDTSTPGGDGTVPTGEEADIPGGTDTDATTDTGTVPTGSAGDLTDPLGAGADGDLDNSSLTDTSPVSTTTTTPTGGGNLDLAAADQNAQNTAAGLLTPGTSTTTTTTGTPGTTPDGALAQEMVVGADGQPVLGSDGNPVLVPRGSVINPDGTITAPGGSTVTNAAGKAVKVPSGSKLEDAEKVVDAEGEPVLRNGQTVTAPQGSRINADGTITTPDGATLTGSDGRSVVVPEGSTLVPATTTTAPDSSLSGALGSLGPSGSTVTSGSTGTGTGTGGTLHEASAASSALQRLATSSSGSLNPASSRYAAAAEEAYGLGSTGRSSAVPTGGAGVATTGMSSRAKAAGASLAEEEVALTSRSGLAGKSGLAAETAAEEAAMMGRTATTSGSSPMVPPMGGAGAAGGQGQGDRARQTWLDEDEDVWGTAEVGTPGVIGG